MEPDEPTQQAVEPDPLPQAPRPPRKNKKRLSPRKKKLLFRVVAVVAVVGVGVGTYFLWPVPQPAPPAPENLNNSVSTLQRLQNNTQRKSDASKIASGIQEFMSNNQGALPTQVSAAGHELTLCGANCADGHSLTLGYFTADGVSFKDFDASLAVPDAETVYLVTKGKCTDDKKGISAAMSTNPRAVAILFGLDSGNGQLEQSCLQL